MVERLIDRLEIALHNGFAPLAICFANALLDLFDSLFTRQDATEGEEAGLHHRIHAPSHPKRASYVIGVDDIQAQFLLENGLTHLCWQVFPHFFGTVNAVQQESAAVLSIFE